ncbi:homeobox-leucine zipper protein HOX11-like isoform X2 [Nicotiana sylvestris]|uniref:Homeobox-leucine zipper protein HOX11-like isoform X1 n=2 Tax=Nicotiana TaxID=4085 RepID=A0A1S3ZKR3_TOBAC|nr:PREDICTED: homeobox-leucine zipper protein HOX11-like isoform X2 [Nicotiana sylvestris]XP_016464966.1 PREDICTED: homeobox-leucine zipper protein HOX11-like isoform X1 [Nicotiana tabacum]
MELALSLGGDTQKSFSFLKKSTNNSSSHEELLTSSNKDLRFCMGLGKSNTTHELDENNGGRKILHLDLLPLSAVPLNQIMPSQIPFPWLSQNIAAEPGLTNGPAGKVLDMNRRPIVLEEEAEEGADLSSPNSNSGVSSFQMEFSSIYRNGNSRSLIGKRDHSEAGDTERGVSDEDENNGLARKKLRLTKEQSAFLEESFKEHNTLNPKQKFALAKQLKLRPRQVEVWFQNRRARTKLKQTELDCEYLKRCCETLTEENRRLQKELQELRALKSSQPLYMQLPATTLTMCPSCERVATTTAAAVPTAAAATSATATNTTLSLAKPNLFPFPPAQVHAPQAAS